MSPNDLTAIRDSIEPDWHELRERRVLEQALAARRRPATRRAIGWPTAIATASVAAVAIAAIFLGPAAPPVARNEAEPMATPTTVEEAAPPHMRFADGSVAVLSAGAAVQIEEQSAETVRVSQTSGAVHYSVVSNPTRVFVVDAAGVRITVLGTEFDVELLEGHVRVVVSRGRVRVSDELRELELARGESLQIAPRPRSEPRPDEPIAPDPSPAPISIEELERRADETRIAGRYDEAAEHLERLMRAAPNDRRALTALFTLGSIRGAQGRHALAARYYARYRARAPNGTLYEDALAEDAIHSAAAGDDARSAQLAREYVQRYPNGAHAAQMRSLIGP